MTGEGGKHDTRYLVNPGRNLGWTSQISLIGCLTASLEQGRRSGAFIPVGLWGACGILSRINPKFRARVSAAKFAPLRVVERYVTLSLRTLENLIFLTVLVAAGNGEKQVHANHGRIADASRCRWCERSERSPRTSRAFFGLCHIYKL